MDPTSPDLGATADPVRDPGPGLDDAVVVRGAVTLAAWTVVAIGAVTAAHGVAGASGAAGARGDGVGVALSQAAAWILLGLGILASLGGPAGLGRRVRPGLDRVLGGIVALLAAACLVGWSSRAQAVAAAFDGGTGRGQLASATLVTPASAVATLALGISLASRGRAAGPARRLPDGLALGAAFLGAVTVFSFVFGVSDWSGVAPFFRMPALGAVAVTAAAFGALASVPGGGLRAPLAGEGVGSPLLRRLLPTALGVPLAVAFLGLHGWRAHLYGTEFGVTFFVLVIDVLLALVVLRIGLSLDRVDSARREAEGALRSSQERFRRLVDSMDDIVFTLDRQERHLGLHGRWIAREGVDPSFMLGMTAREIFGEEAARPHHEANLRALAGERTLYEWSLGVDEGVRSFQTVLSPLYGADGAIEGIVGVSRDVTERRLAEERLARKAGELARTNREIQRFTDLAAHDLQEPLRKIQVLSDRLEAIAGDGLEGRARDHLARIRSAAGRMQELVGALVALAQVDAGPATFRAVDLAALAAEVVADLGPRVRAAGARIDVDVHGVVAGDPAQLRLLLLNLVGNALQHRRPDVPPHVEVRSSDLDGGVRLEVQDDGPGLPEPQLEGAFQPFQRRHRRAREGGLGIGLALCRRIAERHGGTIRAESTPGGGATFVVDLPVVGIPGAE